MPQTFEEDGFYVGIESRFCNLVKNVNEIDEYPKAVPVMYLGQSLEEDYYSFGPVSQLSLTTLHNYYLGPSVLVHHFISFVC